MDLQTVFTGLVVAWCAVLALRRFAGTVTRTWLASGAGRLPGGAALAAWLLPQRVGSACGGCGGCSGVRPASMPPGAGTSSERVITIHPSARTRAALQRPCGTASHWRASSTQ